MNTIAQHIDYSLLRSGQCGCNSLLYADGLVRGEDLVEDAPESAARTTVAKSKRLLAYLLSLSSSHDWILR